MRALVFCLVALAAYKAQGLTLSKPNRNIESAASAIAAAAMKENPTLDMDESGESNRTKENQSRIEKVASNMIRGLFNEAEYLKNETMNILTLHASNATRLNYRRALETLIVIKNMTETANALIIEAINDMERKGYTIKNQTIEEIQSKSQNLTLIFREDVRKAIEKLGEMTTTAHELIDKSIKTLETEGESIKNKTIDEMEFASKNLTSIYQRSIEEARQKIEDMEKSAQKMIGNLIETVGTEGKNFQEKTIQEIKLQANKITEMFHKNINETMAQVDIAIKQKNDQALASIEEVRKTTSSALYKEAEGVRKNFSDHLHDVQQDLQTALDLKVQQIDDNVVVKIQNAINKLEVRETQLESNLDLKKKEIIQELEEKNNKTKFEEELKSVEKSFMNSVNKNLENSEESFLKKFISAITETTQSRTKVFEGALSDEVKEYNMLLKKNKALYVIELERMKESIEAALRIAKGSSTAEDCGHTIEIEGDASKVEIEENNDITDKDNVISKSQETTTCNCKTKSKNETVESKEQQTVSDLKEIENKSNVSTSSISSESSSNRTEKAEIKSNVPMGEKTHGRRKQVIEITTVTEKKTVYIDDSVENKNTSTSSSFKNITLSSSDNTSATTEHRQTDLENKATATSTTEAAIIESSTDAKTTQTTTVAPVDDVEPANIEKDNSSSSSISSESSSNKTEEAKSESVIPMGEETHGRKKKITETTSITKKEIVYIDDSVENKNTSTSSSSENITLSSGDNTSVTTEHSQTDLENNATAISTTEAVINESSVDAKTAQTTTVAPVDDVEPANIEKDNSSSSSISSESSSNKTEEAKSESVIPMGEETHSRKKKITETTSITKKEIVYIDDSVENKNTSTSSSSENITLSSGDNTSVTTRHSQTDLENNATAISTTEAVINESSVDAKTAQTTTVAPVDDVEVAKNVTETTEGIGNIPVQFSNESSIVGTTESAEVNRRPIEKDNSSSSSISSESSSNITEEAKSESVIPMGEETHGRKKKITETTSITKKEIVYIDDSVENKNTSTSSSSENITLSSGDNTSATTEHSQTDLENNATAISTTEAVINESSVDAKTAQTTTVAPVDDVEPAKNVTETTEKIENITVQFSNESSIVGTTESAEVNRRPIEKEDSSSSSISSESSSNKTEEAKSESVIPMGEDTHGRKKKITETTSITKKEIVYIDDSVENKNISTSSSFENITLSSGDNTSATTEHSQTDLENNATAISTTEAVINESSVDAKTAQTTTVAPVDDVEPAKNVTETTEKIENITVQFSNESSIVGTTESAEVNRRPIEKDNSSSSSISSESSSNKTEEAKSESVIPMGEETHGRKKKITETTSITKKEIVYIDDSVENKNTSTSSSSENITLSSGDNTSATTEHSQTDLENTATATSTTEAVINESSIDAKTAQTTTVAPVDDVEPAKNVTETTKKIGNIPVQFSNESSIVGTTESAEVNTRQQTVSNLKEVENKSDVSTSSDEQTSTSESESDMEIFLNAKPEYYTERVVVKSSSESSIVGTTESAVVNTRPVEKDDSSSSSISSESSSNKTEEAKIDSLGPMSEETHGRRKQITETTTIKKQKIEYIDDSGENKNTSTSSSSKNITLSSSDNTSATTEHNQIDLKNNASATSTTEAAVIESSTDAKTTQHVTKETGAIDHKINENISVQSYNESSIVGTTEASQLVNRFGDENSSNTSSDNLTAKSDGTTGLIAKHGSEVLKRFINQSIVIISDENKEPTVVSATEETFPEIDQSSDPELDLIDSGLTTDELIELGEKSIEGNESIGV